MTGNRKFEVNGEPLFIRGANWIVSDGLLRFSKKRYQTDIKFHRDMNLNMIRVWGGALAERPFFYEACDEYGLLVCSDRSISYCVWGFYSLREDTFLSKAFDMNRCGRNFGSQVTVTVEVLSPLILAGRSIMLCFWIVLVIL